MGPPGSQDSHAQAAPGAQRKTGIERRVLTVLFCDLVGSTRLTTDLDPEEMLDVMTTYQTVVTTRVKRFGGHVERFLGDGIVVCFGWPVSDETDAERAVRAALATVDGVQQIKVGKQKLHARIGIASGLVVIGNADDGTAEHHIIGEAPNIAARLQSLAEPDSIAIDELTKALIGDLFACRHTAGISLKGYDKPASVWTVDAEAPVQDRFRALRAYGSAPLVGRNQETAFLSSLWRRTASGEGQVVMVVGEAGIGKSRLVAGLQEAIADETHKALEFFCAPHMVDTALHPIMAHLEQATGLGNEQEPENALHKIAAFFSPLRTTEAQQVSFAELLSLPIGETLAPSVSPSKRRDHAFDVLGRWIEALSDEGPVVLILEDAHWADPTTVELFGQIIDRITGKPIMVLITCRNDSEPPWPARAGWVELELKRLQQKDATRLCLQRIGERTLPKALVDRIIEETDGIPLYIEELTEAVLACGPESTMPDSADGALSVPSGLHASLMARLDRLDGAKELAQIAAVIGREFSHDILSVVAGVDEAELNRGLARLIRSGVVQRRFTRTQPVYAFKHALVRDAAYESLLRKRRATIHARVVDALLDIEADVRDRHPGLLGYHCVRAERSGQAAEFFRIAGEQSAERAATVETHSQLERGLALAASLRPGPDRRTLEAEMKLALGRVLLTTHGNADVEAGEIFEETLRLCRHSDNSDLLTRAYWGVWFNRAHRRELAEANRLAEELLQRATARDSSSGLVVANTMLGIIRFWEGRFAEARPHLEASTALCDQVEPALPNLAIVSKHVDSHARMQLALAMCCLGHLRIASETAEKAASQIRRVRHLQSQALVLAAKCRHDWFVRDLATMRATTIELVDLSQERGVPFYLALGNCHLGWLAVKEGRTGEGFRLLRDGFEALESTDALIWLPYLCGMYAEADIWDGNLKHARSLLEKGLALARQTGGAWFQSETYRLQAAVLLAEATPDFRNAEASLNHSLLAARSQSARVWELRTATDLARVWCAHGKHAAARDLLLPLRAWFDDGWRTPDLDAASALLDEAQSQ